MNPDRASRTLKTMARGDRIESMRDIRDTIAYLEELTDFARSMEMTLLQAWCIRECNALRDIETARSR